MPVALLWVSLLFAYLSAEPVTNFEYMLMVSVRTPRYGWVIRNDQWLPYEQTFEIPLLLEFITSSETRISAVVKFIICDACLHIII